MPRFKVTAELKSDRPFNELSFEEQREVARDMWVQIAAQLGGPSGDVAIKMAEFVEGLKTRDELIRFLKRANGCMTEAIIRATAPLEDLPS